MSAIDSAVAGSDWTDQENDLLVADYFAMLGEEMAGRHYIKRRHNAAIVAATGRSHGSVERKYMNVSAVLVKLSLPRIRGYAPAEHAQFRGLAAAIDRYLSGSQAALEPDVAATIVNMADDPFVDPPPLQARQEVVSHLVV